MGLRGFELILLIWAACLLLALVASGSRAFLRRPARHRAQGNEAERRIAQVYSESIDVRPANANEQPPDYASLENQQPGLGSGRTSSYPYARCLPLSLRAYRPHNFQATQTPWSVADDGILPATPPPVYSRWTVYHILDPRMAMDRA